MSEINSDDLSIAPVSQIISALRSREISALELVEIHLARIDALQDTYHPFTRVLADEARTRAVELDELASKGQFRGSLHGVTLAVKDLMDVGGYPNTAGTSVRREAPAALRNAAGVQSLVDEGAVIIGLTNLHEWAYGGTSDNPIFGPVANPWDPTRIPGGSSGGSAVAVSLGMTAIALGTDTGGSIRIPSSLSGVSGLKTTAGQISTRGVLPLSWTLDTVGPLARRVADLAVPYAALRGNSIDPVLMQARTHLSGVTIGIDRSYYADSNRMDAAVTEAFNAALLTLEQLGAVVRDVNIPLLHGASAAQYAIILSEASSVHSGRFRDDRPTYGADVQRLLGIGDTVLATDYLAAMRFRSMLWEQFAAAFKEVDVLVAPTNPHVATPMNTENLEWPNGESESLLDAIWRHTFPSNLAGLPSLSQPCALTPEGLPVGLQWIAPPGEESLLIALAGGVEAAAGWVFRPPVLS